MTLRLCPIIALMLAVTPALAAGNPDIIAGAIEGYIRPAFAQFHAAAETEQAALATLCATPSVETLDGARTAFKTLALSYARIEFVQIGPLGDGNRAARLLFWPDPKGLTLKQVQAALAERDASATDAATLKEKSVAMQGLGALEYLLFGSGAEALGSGDVQRCDFAAAAGTLVDELGRQMDAEWADPGGVSKALLHPRPEAADYRTQTEVLEKLAATLGRGVEMVRDQRLLPILGTQGGAPKPKAGLFWRSAMSIPMIAANFAGLAEFFAAAKFPEAMGNANAWIASGADFEFANAARATGLVTMPLEDALADEKQHKALSYLVVVANSLQELVGDDLSAALGLSVGFSSLDGD